MLRSKSHKYLSWKERSFLLFFLFIGLAFLPSSMAQEAGGKADAVPYQAISVADPGIAPTSLKLLLRPLSAEELAGELSAWLDLLQSKAAQLSQVELALADPGKKADTAEVAENSKKVLQLGEAKSAMIERVQQVVAVAKSKGVDTTGAELYISSVGGILTGGGAATVLMVMKNWIFSSQGGGKLLRSLGLFALCVVVASLIGRIGSGALGKALDRTGQTSDLLRSFLVHSIRRLALVVGIVVGLSYLGVDIGPMIAAIGGAGFVIGFALKDSLGNFAAGLMILFYRPFDVGHFIKAAGVSGTVESLSLVATILKTPDNQQVIIPNGKIWNDVITNVSVKGTRRVDLVFGVGYEDDLQQTQMILEKLVKDHVLVLNQPEAVIKVNELADSSVNFVVRPWSKTSDYWEVYWDLTRQVKEAFDEAGISIPYPQRDVHVVGKAGGS